MDEGRRGLMVEKLPLEGCDEMMIGWTRRQARMVALTGSEAWSAIG